MPKSQLVFDEGDVADTVKDQFLYYELRNPAGSPGQPIVSGLHVAKEECGRQCSMALSGHTRTGVL